MGARQTRTNAKATEQEPVQLTKSGPSIFNVRNIAILVAGVLISGGLAILTVGGYIAPKIEQDRVDLRVEEPKTTESSFLDSLTFYKIEPMIVNPAGSNGERYLKATISLEMINPEVHAEVEKRIPQIKNQINNVLCSKSIKQVQTNEDREKLRREIMDRVNGILVTGRISNVYLEEFVYQ